MKALIFSVSAGGGHTHAAEAIEKHILLNDPLAQVKIIDTIKYINPILDKVVIGSYLRSLKLSPAIFGKLYNFTETDDSLANVSSRIIEILIYRLIPLIDEFKPDVLITTHPFSTEMVSILKLKKKVSAASVAILTDYAPHNFWLHDGIDAYVVSNCDMVSEMVNRGISRDIVFDFGIPINPDFISTFDRSTTLKSLDLNPNKLTLLLMGGSLGMGKITNVYEQLQQIETDIQIIIITGKNKKLHTQLLDIQEESVKSTRVIGFTNEVNKYMQACDLLITKPGGLTITEAIISKIPMAIFSAIPGQEEKNAEFLIKHNLAISLGDGKNCKQLIDNLLQSDILLKSMKENCYTYSKPNSGTDTYNLLLKLSNTKI